MFRIDLGSTVWTVGKVRIFSMPTANFEIFDVAVVTFEMTKGKYDWESGNLETKGTTLNGFAVERVNLRWLNDETRILYSRFFFYPDGQLFDVVFT